jgi:hypothetical protein
LASYTDESTLCCDCYSQPCRRKCANFTIFSLFAAKKTAMLLHIDGKPVPRVHEKSTEETEVAVVQNPEVAVAQNPEVAVVQSPEVASGGPVEVFSISAALGQLYGGQAVGNGYRFLIIYHVLPFYLTANAIIACGYEGSPEKWGRLCQNKCWNLLVLTS